MKKFFQISFLFILIFSLPSFAEWRMLTKTDNSYEYVDLKNIEIDGEYLRVWYMTDRFEKTSDGVMSAKLLSLVDCNLNRMKDLSYVFHFESMGSRSGSHVNSESEWKYAPPDTLISARIRLACRYIEMLNEAKNNMSKGLN